MIVRPDDHDAALLGTLLDAELVLDDLTDPAPLLALVRNATEDVDIHHPRGV